LYKSFYLDDSHIKYVVFIYLDARNGIFFTLFLIILNLWLIFLFYKWFKHDCSNS